MELLEGQSGGQNGFTTSFSYADNGSYIIYVTRAISVTDAQAPYIIMLQMQGGYPHYQAFGINNLVSITKSNDKLLLTTTPAIGEWTVFSVYKIR